MRKINLFILTSIIVGLFLSCDQAESPNLPITTTYTVTYESNDGTNNTYKETFTKGNSQKLTANTFTAPANNVFAGWNTEKNKSGVWYKNRADFSPTKNITLYAQWTIPIERVKATVEGAVVTIEPDTDGTTFKQALHSSVNDTNRPNITKIMIKVPDGEMIRPESDLSYLFNNHGHVGWSTDYVKLTTIEGLEKLDTENVTDIRFFFAGCKALTSVDFSNFNTKNVTNMSSMFSSCHKLKDPDLSNFNTENVTNMSSMFSHCYSFNNIDLSHFNTKNVTSMAGMFFYLPNLTKLDLSSFNTTKVENMARMFAYNANLKEVNLSSFNTPNLTNIWGMFQDCSSLTSINLSHFTTNKIEEIYSLFSGCSSLINVDLSNWDTTSVSRMSWLFNNCSSLEKLDLSYFRTENVTSMSSMFSGCRSLNTLDLSNWNTQNIVSKNVHDQDCSENIFLNCNELTQSGIKTNNAQLGDPSNIQTKIEALPS